MLRFFQTGLLLLSVFFCACHASPEISTNSNGDATDTYAYSAFGEVTLHTGNTVNPFQYIGRDGYYLDAESGEHNARQRQFVARYGRWLSVDPEPAYGDSNLYLYCLNSPVQYSDPSGLRPVCCGLVYNGWRDKWTVECPADYSATECCDYYRSPSSGNMVLFVFEGACPKDKPKRRTEPPGQTTEPMLAGGVYPVPLPGVVPAIPATIAAPIAGFITFFSAKTCQAPDVTTTPEPQPAPKPLNLPPIGWPIELPRPRPRPKPDPKPKPKTDPKPEPKPRPRPRDRSECELIGSGGCNKVARTTDTYKKRCTYDCGKDGQIEVYIDCKPWSDPPCPGSDGQRVPV